MISIQGIESSVELCCLVFPSKAFLYSGICERLGIPVSIFLVAKHATHSCFLIGHVSLNGLTARLLKLSDMQPDRLDTCA